MMILFNKFISLIIKLLMLPLIFLLSLADKNMANRLINKRLTFKDTWPHLCSILSFIIFYYIFNKNTVNFQLYKLTKDLHIILNFQAILFGTSLAVSTFILSIFNPNILKYKYPNEEDKIFDVVDDLRIANKIIFIVLIYIFIIWLLLTLNIINNNLLVTTSIFSFLIWSLFAINSLIRGVFLLVNIDH